MNWYKKAQINWGGKILYHGTSKEGAANILAHGVDNTKSQKGYFGRGFYMAEDRALAQSNYADWADEEEDGVVLAVQITPTARILDLRDERDSEIYVKISQYGRLCGDDDFDRIMQRHGIDGLFDRSFGGVVIYNPNAVVVKGIVEV